MSQDSLSGSDRRLILVLGAPAAGLAMTVTVISTYLPVLVVDSSNAIVVGALVGGEGFFGIFMPGLVGSFSDRTARTVKQRLALMLPCAGLVVAGVWAIAAIAWSGGAPPWWYAVPLVAVYAGYYACLAPYWALYPDLVPDENSGRARSAESTWRVAGVGVALVAGGLLFDLSRGTPFALGGLVVLATLGLLALGLRGRWDVGVESDPDDDAPGIRQLLADRAIRNLCLAEGLWNFALSALRAFVVLFFVVGTGHSATFVATVIFPLVALGIAIAAPTAGWIADRWGHVPLLTTALVVYGVGMAVPGVIQDAWVAAMIPPVAMGAATVMTLPFSALMRLLPGDNHGAASGLFGLFRGVGSTLGPVVTGTAIVLLEPVLSDTHGYAAMWLMCSAALLASIPLLRTLSGDERLDGSRSGSKDDER